MTPALEARHRRVRGRRSSRLFLGVVLTLAGPLGASDSQPRPVVAHTGAYVRTVTAVITDAKGRPLGEPPRVADLEVLEDGVPATLLAVEPIREPSVPLKAPARAPASAAVPVAAERRQVHQTLYVDATLMHPFSVRDVARAVHSQLPALLVTGPLEIVVARPAPKVWQAATSDAAVLGEALDRLGREVKGQDAVGALRREVRDARQAAGNKNLLGQPFGKAPLDIPGGLPTQRDSSAGADPDIPADQARVDLKPFLDQEVTIVSASLARLKRWAFSSPQIDYGILYWANDGFDTDQRLFYTPGNLSLSRAEASDRIPALVKECSDALLRRGWVAMPVGLGAVSQAPMARTAEEGITTTATQPEEGIPLFGRPADPLRSVAEATGGEVIVSAGQLGDALQSVSKAYLVSYQTATPRDGRSHPLVVRSRRRSMVVRASDSVAAGTPETVAAIRAAELLAGEAAPAEGLPVTLALESAEPAPAGRHKGLLVTRVDLRSLRDLVARLGGGRLRVSVLVKLAEGEADPHHEEVALPASGLAGSWALRSSLVWPAGATHVAVVAEELATGIWGGASIPLVVSAAAERQAGAAAAPASVSAPGAPPSGPEPPARQMEILTFASGLVTGTITVNTELGPARSADLLLDGRVACALTPAARSCPVPLGNALAVHRLDLVRTDGAAAEPPATRWLNRPGASAAEIRGRLSCEGGTPAAACVVSIGWVHPDALDPETWSVTLDGAEVSKRPEKGFRLLVPGDGRTHVIAVDAAFADGARATLVRLLGPERTERTGDTLQAVPLELAEPKKGLALADLNTRLSVPAREVELGDSEVFVVLDPVASQRLYEQSLEAMGGSFPGIARGRLHSALEGLGPLRVVHPESPGLRFFTQAALPGGRERAELFFHGPAGAPSGPLLAADAVAAAGVLAAGEPRRRAVVLVLGDERPDRSRFSVQDVKAYLSELMVPLVVIRTGPGADGRWGTSVTVRTMSELRQALEAVAARLSAQRLAWIGIDTLPADLAIRGEGIRIAGRP